MTTGDLEELPSPSKAVLYLILGFITIAGLAIFMLLVTPRDTAPSLNGRFDAMEQRVVDVYGVDKVTYNSPATNTMTVTVGEDELKCTAPTDEEMTAKRPLICGENKTINAK